MPLPMLVFNQKNEKIKKLNIKFSQSQLHITPSSRLQSAPRRLCTVLCVPAHHIEQELERNTEGAVEMLKKQNRNKNHIINHN